MKKAAILSILAALVAANVPAAEAAQWGRGYGYHHGPHYAWRGRPVYSVYRSPRFVPPPALPQPFFFEFFPTNRVNTHMF